MVTSAAGFPVSGSAPDVPAVPEINMPLASGGQTVTGPGMFRAPMLLHQQQALADEQNRDRRWRG